MKMKRLLPALLFLAACGSANSPQGTFDAAKKAVESKNWRGFYNCCDPENASMMVMAGVMMAGFSVINNKPAEEELNAIMKKHGIADDKKKDPKETMKDVKDPGALFEELMKFSDKHSKPGEQAALEVTGDLKDVKIDGDRASGTMTKKDGKTDTMKFVRRAGRWYIALEK